MWNCEWVYCESEEKGLKMTRENSEDGETLQSEHHDPKLSNTFEWLDGQENEEIVIPLGDDEEFCCEDEEMIVESDIEKSVFHLELSDEELNECETDLEDEDNGKVLLLFISHILCSQEYKNSFKLGSLVFRKVQIFGIVVSTHITNGKNNLLIDDGTAQIMCYMEDSINYDDEDDYLSDEDYSVDSPYYKFSQSYRKMMKENEYVLPTFNNINVGDSVYIGGKLSLYKGNYYIFVDRLNRPRGTKSYINFVETIFKSFESSYYDFWYIGPNSYLN